MLRLHRQRPSLGMEPCHRHAALARCTCDWSMTDKERCQASREECTESQQGADSLDNM